MNGRQRVDASPAAQSPAGAGTRRSTGRDLVHSAVALFAVFAAWALANPLMAAPDEPAHLTKAAAVVRGQLLGQDIDPDWPGAESVEVPALIVEVNRMGRCFAFKPDVTAACSLDPPDTLTGLATTISTAATYNPIYYAVVGLPSLLPPSIWTVYAMRLVSAALCALALGWALTQSLALRDGRWLRLGTVLAATPMVVYLASTINPAAVEIAVAVALWVSLSVVIRDPDPSRLAGRMAAIGVMAAVFVNLRGLSPLFLAIIMLTCVAFSPWASTWRVLRAPTTWPWVGLVGAASVAALAWTRAAGSLETDGVVNHPTLDFWTAAQWTLGDTSVYLANMMGQFGWVDTDLPLWLLMLIAFTTGSFVLVGLALSGRRERVLIVALAAATIVVPVVIHASQARYFGIIWQGRYFLPAAVGLPVLAAVGASAPLVQATRFRRRAAVVLGGAWVLYQLLAFGVNLRRYTRGVDVGLFATPPDPWSPPVPPVLLAGLLLIGLVALVASCVPRSGDVPAHADAARRDAAVVDG